MPDEHDLELTDFEASLLRGAEQAANGQFSRVHTPEDIRARRTARAAAHIDKAKEQLDIVYLDPEVADAFRAVGRDWQTRVNDILRDWLRAHQPS